ncbi:SIS domain-containing protein [Saccharomonospora cyanea]|uniref:Glucosamine 6-phosphate synthetase n=1 Tax=Saccharomonospora cyanea NA-134 TaxID=882082 RepID=H5XLM0_9PSEU|nr:SIS domain-containing protein [Saccharomonospora cyanea]EHR60918.1 glucosamine 6-phosphate synthetase [Saccharomonospora cyanea NA-134]
MTTPLVSEEIASQPHAWRQAAALAASAPLPARGLRVAVVGCGTSWFVAQAYAVRRESLGHGVTDAFAASEFPVERDYDLVVAISRSGTTTEVLDLLGTLRGRVRTLAVIGDPESPGRGAADDVVVLPFADERSVVQTRFATSALTLLRAGLGDDTESLAAAADEVVHWPVPEALLERTQFTFLGRGWSVGLAHEAALKAREAAIAWTESYPAMDYRHGPKAISDSDSAVVFLGERPDGLVAEVEATGALALWFDEDPQLTLVRCQRFAVEYALSKGLDPDRPRNLTRSIVLSGE